MHAAQSHPPLPFDLPGTQSVEGQDLVQILPQAPHAQQSNASQEAPSLDEYDFISFDPSADTYAFHDYNGVISSLVKSQDMRWSPLVDLLHDDDQLLWGNPWMGPEVNKEEPMFKAEDEMEDEKHDGSFTESEASSRDVELLEKAERTEAKRLLNLEIEPLSQMADQENEDSNQQSSSDKENVRARTLESKAQSNGDQSNSRQHPSHETPYRQGQQKNPSAHGRTQDQGKSSHTHPRGFWIIEGQPKSSSKPTSANGSNQCQKSKALHRMSGPFSSQNQSPGPSPSKYGQQSTSQAGYEPSQGHRPQGSKPDRPSSLDHQGMKRPWQTKRSSTARHGQQSTSHAAYGSRKWHNDRDASRPYQHLGSPASQYRPQAASMPNQGQRSKPPFQKFARSPSQNQQGARRPPDMGQATNHSPKASKAKYGSSSSQRHPVMARPWQPMSSSPSQYGQQRNSHAPNHWNNKRRSQTPQSEQSASQHHQGTMKPSPATGPSTTKVTYGANQGQRSKSPNRMSDRSSSQRHPVIVRPWQAMNPLNSQYGQQTKSQAAYGPKKWHRPQASQSERDHQEAMRPYQPSTSHARYGNNQKTPQASQQKNHIDSSRSHAHQGSPSQPPTGPSTSQYGQAAQAHAVTNQTIGNNHGYNRRRSQPHQNSKTWDHEKNENKRMRRNSYRNERFD